MMHGEAMQSFTASLWVSTGYITSRIVVFIILFIITVIIFVKNRELKNINIIAISLLTLPFMEKLGGALFACLYLTALFLWLARAFYVALKRYEEIRTKLSAYSIKNAIDSMGTGILFCEKDGSILLSNSQMEALIKTILGEKTKRNANYIYGRLEAGKINPECKITMFEGQITTLLGDNSAWMFTKTELPIKGKSYIQYSAANISERWKLTEQLQARNEELKQKNEELKETIANLHILSRERETQKVKWHAHDVLGQSLSFLLRGIRSGETGQNEFAFDYNKFNSLTRGLLDELKSEKAVTTPQDEFDSMKQVFGSIGVEVKLNGGIPEENGNLILDIIRESVTNAVRHGFATVISIDIGFQDETCNIKIRDNGYANNQTITEGGGISSMRKKLEEYGGILKIIPSPEFVLTVDLPASGTPKG